MSTIPAFVGVPEAAKILDLSEIRVKQLARAGRVGSLVAGRYLFTRDELRKFKRKKRIPGRPKGAGKKS